MKIEKKLVELLLSPLFHLISSILLAITGLEIVEKHPAAATYLLYIFAILSLILTTGLWRLGHKQKTMEHLQQERERARLLEEGRRYPGGELDAITDIKQDINSLHRGATVTICGTGATAIIYVALEIYEALKRGVNFEVFVLHPHDELVERLAEMESDIFAVVVKPILERLRGEEELRKLLEPEWCDKLITTLNEDTSVCSLHSGGHAECSLHGRVICTSAAIWQQISKQVANLNPLSSNKHGELSLSGYHIIPSVKAWRFSAGPSETSYVWYYVADHLYHRGVGVDNPMRRFERGSEGPTFVNIKHVDTYLERVKIRSEELYKG